MSISSERLDFTLEQAAREFGLQSAGHAPSLAVALEQNHDLWSRWAKTERRELGGQTPAQFAAGLDLPALLRYLDSSARDRHGTVARLWAEELARRLTAEADATPSGSQPGPIVAALSKRVLAEPEDEWDPAHEAMGALDVLGRWGHPAAVPALMLGLATERNDLRGAAAYGLGQVGLPALAGMEQALARSQDPDVRTALLTALSQLPRVPQVTDAFHRAWSAGNAADRMALLQAIGLYGEPDLLPLVLAEMAEPRHRHHWALGRVAVHRLTAGDAAPAGVPPAPPPGPPGAELEDLAAAAEHLGMGGLAELAADWLREALERLSSLEQADPGQVDWLVYERIHALADRMLNRSPEAAMHRFLEYCAGAMQFYGALSLEHLIGTVSFAGAIVPAEPDAIWAVLRTDRRFALHTGRIVALPAIEDAEDLIRRRSTTGLPPAIFPLGALALAARGLAHLGWTAAEAEAADLLALMLPPELSAPEKVAELQAALRSTGVYVEAFRRWVQTAMEQGIAFDEQQKLALIQLWEQTARWELFGHTPAGARELLEAQDKD